MAAILLIDQAGLPAGTPGFARTDGLNTGALVTIQSVGAASTHEARILTAPALDTTAFSSFTQTAVSPIPTWTFSPTASVDGMYRIELVTDRGLTSEDRQVRVFGIRDGNGYLFPSYGLVSDPAANTPDLSDPDLFLEFVQGNELNEPRAGFPNGYPFGWQAELDAILRGATSGGGGGGGIAPNYGALLFEWNKTDLTQFDTEATFSDGSSLTGTVAMTYNATGWRDGPTIDFTASSLDGGGIFPLLAGQVTLPDHFWVYARLVHVDFSDSSLWGCIGCFGSIDTTWGRDWKGIVARRSGSSANEVRLTTAGASAQILRTTGVNNQSPATTTWVQKTEDLGGSEFQYECWRQAGQNPTEWGVHNVHRDYQFIDSGGLCRSDCSSFGDPSPDWDGEDMTRVGIGMMRSSNGNGVVRFSEFKIFEAA